jgi:hypothetical protein
MTLYTALQKAQTEEDVKDAYIKALRLKRHAKGLIDIQSKDISRTMCALIESS